MSVPGIHVWSWIAPKWIEAECLCERDNGGHKTRVGCVRVYRTPL